MNICWMVILYGIQHVEHNDDKKDTLHFYYLSKRVKYYVIKSS